MLTFNASAIVVAAGSSARMGGKVRKPYLKLRGKPILTWSLQALAQLDELSEIVLVTRPEDRKRALEAVKLAKLRKGIKLMTADGGQRRQDSVFNGLMESAASAQVVLIHDAARPFPRLEAIRAACGAAILVGGAILATRVKDTVKREVSTNSSNDPTPLSVIEMTVPRAGLWLAQTPQVFRRERIISLFERLRAESPDVEVTDDAAICERFGEPVELIESSETNFKVTRPEDVQIAEAFLKAGLLKELEHGRARKRGGTR